MNPDFSGGINRKEEYFCKTLGKTAINIGIFFLVQKLSKIKNNIWVRVNWLVGQQTKTKCFYS